MNVFLCYIHVLYCLQKWPDQHFAGQHDGPSSKKQRRDAGGSALDSIKQEYGDIHQAPPPPPPPSGPPKLTDWGPKPSEFETQCGESGYAGFQQGYGAAQGQLNKPPPGREQAYQAGGGGPGGYGDERYKAGDYNEGYAGARAGADQRERRADTTWPPQQDWPGQAGGQAGAATVKVEKDAPDTSWPQQKQWQQYGQQDKPDSKPPPATTDGYNYCGGQFGGGQAGQQANTGGAGMQRPPPNGAPMGGVAEKTTRQAYESECMDYWKQQGGGWGSNVQPPPPPPDSPPDGLQQARDKPWAGQRQDSMQWPVKQEGYKDRRQEDQWSGQTEADYREKDGGGGDARRNEKPRRSRWGPQAGKSTGGTPDGAYGGGYADANQGQAQFQSDLPGGREQPDSFRGGQQAARDSFADKSRPFGSGNVSAGSEMSRGDGRVSAGLQQEDRKRHFPVGAQGPQGGFDDRFSGNRDQQRGFQNQFDGKRDSDKDYQSRFDSNRSSDKGFPSRFDIKQEPDRGYPSQSDTSRDSGRGYGSRDQNRMSEGGGDRRRDGESGGRSHDGRVSDTRMSRSSEGGGMSRGRDAGGERDRDRSSRGGGSDRFPSRGQSDSRFDSGSGGGRSDRRDVDRFSAGSAAPAQSHFAASRPPPPPRDEGSRGEPPQSRESQRQAESGHRPGGESGHRPGGGPTMLPRDGASRFDRPPMSHGRSEPGRPADSRNAPPGNQQGNYQAGSMPQHVDIKQEPGSVATQQKGALLPPNRGGPPPNMAGPPPNRAGPPPNRAGPPPNGAGPPPNRAGPPPDRAGPPPDRAGAPPNRAGPPPDRAGPPPDRAGAPPNRTGPSPDRAGPSPDRAGAPPNRAGPSPDRAGPPPDRAGPPPNLLAAKLDVSGPPEMQVKTEPGCEKPATGVTPLVKTEDATGDGGGGSAPLGSKPHVSAPSAPSDGPPQAAVGARMPRPPRPLAPGQGMPPRPRPGFDGARPGFGGSRPAFGGPRPGFGGPRPGFAGPRPGFAGARPGFGGPRPDGGVRSLLGPTAAGGFRPPMRGGMRGPMRGAMGGAPGFRGPRPPFMR